MTFRLFNVARMSLSLGLMFSLWAMTCRATEITSAQAQKAVGNWIRRDAAPLDAKLGGTALNAVTYTNSAGDSLFHVVPLDGGGFVVTSADDGILPIIAFSEGDNLVSHEGNPLWTLLNKDLAQRRDALTARRATLSGGSVAAASVPQTVQDSPETMWADLLADRQSSSTTQTSTSEVSAQALTEISDVRVSPILQSHWGQSTVAGFLGNYPCYNYYTPNGYVCGCVATAMAQIMRYHRYPAASVSAQTFNCSVDGASRSLTMLGGVYDWDNMMLTPDEGGDAAPSATIRAAIGKLCYDAGVSVKMNYASGSSGAYSTDVPKALTDVFGYASAFVCGADSASVSEADIRNAILVNLDCGQPVFLDISGAGRHAVVADGYGYNSSVRYIHLNMGWNGDGSFGGYQNAWYNVPIVDTAQGTYSVLNAIVYNIFPDKAKGLVSGRVLSFWGTPVAGATVWVKDSVTGDTLLTLETDSKGMYAFNSAGFWSGKVSATDGSYISRETSVTVRPSNNTTIGNVWGVNMYLTKSALDTVKFDARGGTAPIPLSITVTNGFVYGALATTTRTGHTFDGWWTGVNGTGTQVFPSTIFTGTPAQTLYAKWTTNSYRLRVTSAYGGAWPAADINVPYGTTIDVGITNSPFVRGSTQYVCTGWSMTGNSPLSGASTRFTMTLTNDASLTWQWGANYYLTVIPPLNGTVNVSSGWKPVNTVLTVTADPNPAYQVGYWLVNGKKQSEGALVLPLTSAETMTLEVIFKKKIAMPWLDLLLE